MSPYLDTGDPVPDFTLPATDGRLHSLSDHRGQGVLVVFLRHVR